MSLTALIIVRARRGRRHTRRSVAGVSMSTIERDAGATTEPSSHWTVTAKALLATEPAGRVLALAKMEPRVRAAIAAEVCRLEPLKQPSSGAPR